MCAVINSETLYCTTYICFVDISRKRCSPPQRAAVFLHHLDPWMWCAAIFVSIFSTNNSKQCRTSVCSERLYRPCCVFHQDYWLSRSCVEGVFSMNVFIMSGSWSRPAQAAKWMKASNGKSTNISVAPLGALRESVWGVGSHKNDNIYNRICSTTCSRL